ncbi:hypothetical protein ACFL3V_06365 [Nanoarchaeota archaeon]
MMLMEECSQVNCRYPATDEFKGSKVCYNCLEVLRYEEKVSRPKECSEPGCHNPINREFKGKRLCRTCWKRYKSEKDRMMMDFRIVR